MKEVWKAIDWAPNYEVSDQGSVRSLDRLVSVCPNTGNKKRSAHNKLRKGKVLKPSAIRYARVVICGKNCSVHRLVAEAFLGPCPEGHIVCHGNGGPFDNTLGNLSYGTPAKNNGEDRRRDGTLPLGSKCKASKLTESQVIEIKQRSRQGQSRASIARDFFVTPEAISAIALGRTWAWLEVPA